MRVISYRKIISVLVALAGLSVSACSDLSRQTPLSKGTTAEKIVINQQDRDISNRLGRVWMRVARQAMEDGDPETAARFFQKASQSAPDSPRPVIGLADAHARQGNVEQAARAFRTALKIDPKNHTARVSLGNLLVAQGKIEEGVGFLTQTATTRRPSAAMAAPRAPAERKNDDIFSLISAFFQSAEPQEAAPEPAAGITAPAARNTAAPAARKLMIPASGARPGFQPPNADPTSKIERILNKIEPTAVPQKSGDRTEKSAPKPHKVSHRPPRPTRSTRLAMAFPADRALREALPQPGKAPSAEARYTIQLAAYRHLENAIRGQRLLARGLPDQFPKLEVFVRKNQAGHQSRANYRLRSRGTTSRSRANALCRQAALAGQACLVIRQTAATWQPVEGKTPSHAVLAPKTENTVAKAPPAPAALQPLTGNPQYRIQLAAYRHLKNAMRGKQILTRLLPEGFPGLDILKRDMSKRNEHARDVTPINFRIRSSSPWPESRARKFCDSARATGVACLLIRHGNRSWRSVSADRPSHASVPATGRRAAKPFIRTHLIATR